MKTMTRAMTAILLLAASCGGGCAGAHARQHVLLPAMQQAWSGEHGLHEQAARSTGIEPDVDVAHSVVAQADEAMRAGDHLLIAAVTWERIDELVLADIVRRVVAGEIGLQVGDLQRERLLQFQRSRQILLAEVPR